MTQKQFLETYNISTADFESTGLDFQTLLDIKADYQSQFQKFDDAGANLVRTLLRFDLVHSVKYRIKDSEHLMAKIIRKQIKSPNLDISIEKYTDHIRDIIGIRILHLFKDNWMSIHDQLIETYKLIGKPEANVRKGDLPDYVAYYKSKGCKVTNHPAGYRSVHYLIKTEATRRPLICEIQVRTIFEEAWSEIDHLVRYPYFTENNTVNQYLGIFNRLAGSADEMGGFVLHLKQAELLNASIQVEFEKLKTQIENSSMEEQEKLEMANGLKNIVIPEMDLTNFSMAKLGSALQNVISSSLDPALSSFGIAAAAAAAVGRLRDTSIKKEPGK